MAKSRESSIRWTGIVITQLGYAINLILAFATAALGFSLSLLRDKDFAPQPSARGLFYLTLVALLASIGIGIASVVNRLLDFRATRGIATEKEKLEEKETQRDKINDALRQSRLWSKPNCGATLKPFVMSWYKRSNTAWRSASCRRWNSRNTSGELIQNRVVSDLTKR